MKIRRVKAKIIKNSLGKDTIEVTVNRKYKGSVPLGVSVGKNEAKPFPYYGVPFDFVNKTLHKGFKGYMIQDFHELEEVERILSDKDGFEKIGGNTILAFEYALLRAMSGNEVWKFLNPSCDEMPIPIGCCVGGGKHYLGESVDFQEVLVIPHGENFHDNVLVNSWIHKKIDNDHNPVERSFTQGWILNMDNVKTLEYVRKLIDEAFDKFDVHVGLGLDFAASHNFNGDSYFYRKGKLSRESQIRYVNSLINTFSLEYVEDPVHEDDVDGFGMIKGDVICGDDFVYGNLERLKEVAGKINCVCIKPTQAGSLIKVKNLIDWAKENNIEVVMSHRSGETDDSMIADLSAAWKTQYIKTGIVGKFNTPKIKRLKEIEKSIL